MVAEYCGYIGTAISRSTPPAIISRTTSATGGLPICMPNRTGTSGSAACKQLGLPAGVVQQRRAGDRIPDASIFRRRLGRPPGQDEQRDDDFADERRFDDARVAEKLAEIAAQGRGRRGVGSAELDEQDAGWHSDKQLAISN